MFFFSLRGRSTHTKVYGRGDLLVVQAPALDESIFFHFVYLNPLPLTREGGKRRRYQTTAYKGDNFFLILKKKMQFSNARATKTTSSPGGPPPSSSRATLTRSASPFSSQKFIVATTPNNRVVYNRDNVSWDDRVHHVGETAVGAARWFVWLVMFGCTLLVVYVIYKFLWLRGTLNNIQTRVEQITGHSRNNLMQNYAVLKARDQLLPWTVEHVIRWSDAVCVDTEKESLHVDDDVLPNHGPSNVTPGGTLANVNHTPPHTPLPPTRSNDLSNLPGNTQGRGIHYKESLETNKRNCDRRNGLIQNSRIQYDEMLQYMTRAYGYCIAQSQALIETLEQTIQPPMRALEVFRLSRENGITSTDTAAWRVPFAELYRNTRILLAMLHTCTGRIQHHTDDDVTASSSSSSGYDDDDHNLVVIPEIPKSMIIYFDNWQSQLLGMDETLAAFQTYKQDFYPQLERAVWSFAMRCKSRVISSTTTLA